MTVKSLESQYYVIAAYKNGPRGWTMDTITLPVGSVVAFHGIQTRWMGEGKLPQDRDSAGRSHGAPQAAPVAPEVFDDVRNKGKPVFILEDPERTPWVMQAFGQIVDPTLTYDSLKKGDLQVSNADKFVAERLSCVLRLPNRKGCR